MMNLTEYQEKFGPVTYPEEFKENLEGLSIEEQLKYFRIANGLYRKAPVQERVKNKYDYSSSLDKCEDVQSIIIHDNRIVGVMVKEQMHNKIIPCLIEQGYCCHYGSETDGSGEKEYILYRYLICVTEHFE